jgi:Cu+-exporting ATPase
MISEGSNAPEAFAPKATAARLQLKIGGLSCSFCAASITKALSRLDGVHNANVNLAHEEALVEFDPSKISEQHIKETLRDLGYTVRDPKKVRTFEDDAAELWRERRKLFIATGFTALALAAMIAMWTKLVPAMALMSVLAWFMPALAIATVFGPGWFILKMAWASLRRGILNQHVLLEFGAFAALAGGFLALANPAYPLDFFAVAVFITTYHLLSGYVSLLIRTRSSQAVRKLMDLLPATARVVRDGREEELPLEDVLPGDRVRVRPGESIPVDGTVEEGSSGVDQSVVTGESIPQEKNPGDEVIGGSINQTGTLLVRVTKIGEQSFLQQVARQVEEARVLKPGLLVLVDHILQIYVPAVLIFAGLAIFIWIGVMWGITGTPQITRGIIAALAVLVMGYPCALGMATPLAMIRGGGMAAQRGILLRYADAFQALKDVRRIVLDKTGTITQGKPSVVEIAPVGNRDANEVLRIAASAESASEHPLARAVVDAATSAQLDVPPAGAFASVPGKGVTATVEGRRIAIGSPRYVQDEGLDFSMLTERIETMQSRGWTVVALAIDGRPAALIGIADTIKADAAEAIRQMRAAGLEPIMLTGDNTRTAKAVAQQVGITDYRAEVLPQDKAAIVRELQAQGHRVAMVGDGINDAPALMQADVGIAIGAGTDIAIESADVVLIGERLGAVVDAYYIGKASYRKTVQNLSLALAFNGIGVPFAVTGLVHPIWAMVAMAASVTTVLTNSFGGKLLPRAPRRAAAAAAHRCKHELRALFGFHQRSGLQARRRGGCQR